MENYNKNLFDRFLAGIAVVNVKTQDEHDQFTTLLEKETSLKWVWGAIPTHFGGWTGKGTCIRRVVSSDMITFGDITYYDSKGYEIIDFSDLMKKENNMKFKVGDKVRVRNWNSMAKEFGLDDYGNIYLGGIRFFCDGMKSLCGTVHTIDEIDGSGYRFKTHCYWLTDDMLEPVKAETNGEHFRKELREFKGHDVAIVDGKPVRCCSVSCWYCLFKHGICCNQKELFKKWCAEPYKEPKEENKPILDKVEHDYLASVIAPKKIYERVEYIEKFKGTYNKYYIFIGYENESIYLPYFKEKDHMYDGMEPNKKYTLKELGLEKEE